MKKKIFSLSILVLIITVLNVFAWSISHVYKGGEKFGVFTNKIKAFAEFPNTVNDVYNILKNNSFNRYLIKADPKFKSINLIENNIYALNSTFQEDNYTYKLYNLKNDSTIFSWKFSRDDFKGEYERYSRSHPQNPILLRDTSIIGMLYGSKNLFRIDKNSKVVWNNNSRVFHHSLNLSHDNYLWACGKKHAYTKNNHSNNFTIFDDELILKVDIETGEIIFEKSISDIFIENGYLNMVHGYVNSGYPKAKDLYHMNDIQPVITQGNYWKIGDLFISLRHRSMILQYRPETNQIVRIISGPFLAQHDVDIISSNEISIFNNNRTATKPSKSVELLEDPIYELNSSNIIIYNFSDSTFRMPALKVFESQKIYTGTQGLHEFLGNGDLFVESTEQGKIFLVRNGRVIYKNYANSINSHGMTEYPHWIRIYENLDFLK